MSLRTVQRILAQNSLKPWRYQSWIHPRDPHFREKAEVILGLYEGVWKGRRLGPEDQLLSADEKPSKKFFPPGKPLSRRWKRAPYPHPYPQWPVKNAVSRHVRRLRRIQADHPEAP